MCTELMFTIEKSDVYKVGVCNGDPYQGFVYKAPLTYQAVTNTMSTGITVTMVVFTTVM